MENWKETFVYIKTKEDEKKWKNFLKEYFPNHYDLAFLSRDLVERPNKYGPIQSKRLGICINGYGWLSAMCLCKARNHYVKVKDFEDFKVGRTIEFIPRRCFDRSNNKNVEILETISCGAPYEYCRHIVELDHFSFCQNPDMTIKFPNMVNYKETSLFVTDHPYCLVYIKEYYKKHDKTFSRRVWSG